MVPMGKVCVGCQLDFYYLELYVLVLTPSPVVSSHPPALWAQPFILVPGLDANPQGCVAGSFPTEQPLALQAEVLMLVSIDLLPCTGDPQVCL